MIYIPRKYFSVNIFWGSLSIESFQFVIFREFNLFCRISYLAESIFAEVDNKALANCKIVSETWASFIDMKKVKWFRIILKYAENMTEFSDHWKILMGRTPVKIVEETALTIEEFFRANLKRKDYQWSPFVIAADRGRIELYQYISEKLIKKDPAQVYQTIALEFAAMAGHLEVCKFIISSLAEKNLRLDIFLITSLHCAARYGQLEVFKLLTESVSDKNPQCHLGWTPLHEAASGGHLKYLKIKDYMWAKLNLAAVFDVLEHDGALPLTIAAAESGHLKICQYLIANVIDKNPINTVQNVPINAPINDGPTVLHVAAWFGQFEACKLIVENVVDKNPRNLTGRTPLQLAAEAGHLEVCQYIVKNISVDRNVTTDLYGRSPIHFAVAMGHLEVCKFLIKNMQDKIPQTSTGRTPLHLAAKHGHLEIGKLLIVYMENKNPMDNQGWTPLHFAAKNGHGELCKLIAGYIDEKNPVSNDGFTPHQLMMQFSSDLFLNSN